MNVIGEVKDFYHRDNFLAIKWERDTMTELLVYEKIMMFNYCAKKFKELRIYCAHCVSCTEDINT